METQDHRRESRGALRQIELLFGLASLGALALGCNVASAPEPSQQGKLENVGQSKAAIAGIDGNVTVSTAGATVNQYTSLSADAAAGATSLTVASVAALTSGSDALATGDLLLVIQMQGATLQTATNDATWGTVTALGGAGNYELVEVSGVNANTITLSCALAHAYRSAGAVQVVRVPQYDTLTLATGASITAPAWNGTTGGVVVVHAKTTVNFGTNGAIDVSGRGFRGGITDNASNGAGTDTAIFTSATDLDGARKGEGIGGFDVQYGRAPAANGGGGGNSHNGGGGGGSNARSGAAWTGQGFFDLTVTGGASAWLLDPNYSATASEGGGRGGYTFSNNNQNALTLAPGDNAWGGNLRRQRGGMGGHPVDNDPTARLYFGGGGGAGDGNNGHSGPGGAGGGIVIVLAGSVTGTGSILASGAAGTNANSTTGGAANGDAPGGGGGGGTVIVNAASVSAITIHADGGAGGQQIVNNANEAEGPGGGGGGGYVAVTGTVTATVAGGACGTTTSPAVTEFPANGATSGTAGQAVLNTTFTAPYCTDTTAPDTTIVTKPANPTNDPTGDFTFTSNDAQATFECSVDGGAFAACTTPFATGALADGSHTFAVRAKDTVGNVDATPASFTWVVDTTPPDTTIATHPNDPSATGTGDFTFTANEAATFECQLDGGAFAACPASFTTPTLANGSHTLNVRAIDAAGNVDATPATFTWQVAVAKDSDGDGISDPDEGVLGTDPYDADSDDDGVPDGEEPMPGVDSDDDGLINALDPDSDNDGIFDGTELGKGCSAADTDASKGHCVPDADPTTHTNPLDPDTDHGGVPDGTEDANHNGDIDTGEGDPNDPSDDSTMPLDSDGDGLSDAEETLLHSNPRDADTDDDGVIDGAEPNPSDDVDGDGLIDVLDPDSDNDGLFDGTELGLGCSNADTDVSRHLCRADGDAGQTKTSPLLRDTDGGGVSDGSEDANLNGVVDSGETDPTTGHGSDDTVTDRDGDGLSDGLEHTLGSDPDDKDSDDDGVPDGSEPNPSADADADGLPDVLDVDSDNDGLFDGTELGFSCSLADTNNALHHCRADADTSTHTSPVNPDTDFGTVKDGSEDANLDGKADSGEGDPTSGHGSDDAAVVDTDGDGLSDGTETTLGSDPNDSDSDDDGLLDGAEPNPSDDRDGDDLVDVLDPDSDGDGLFDGTEAGLGCSNADTDTSKNACISDQDPSTTTLVLVSDTDHGGVSDGMEDASHDGRVDGGERDPLNPADDSGQNGEGGAGGEAGAGPAGAAGVAGTTVAGTGGGAGTAGASTAGGGQGGGAGTTVTAGGGGTSGSGGGSGTGGSGGTAGGGGTGGSGGTAGSGGSGGTGGTTGGTASTKTDEHVVVLGGGLCSTSPVRGTNASWLVLVGLGLLRARRLPRRRARG